MMNDQAFKDFRVALEEAKSLTQEMLRLTKRDLKTVRRIEQTVNDLQSKKAVD
ncbi:hypothetical protein [Agrobacterium rosae]|uniref:hypothetical protein n=1 Tax=Agrobacterium rosae TaxID=1972867 RepID=UPI0012967CF4|nr:hypothetical protein [Agrobacterium rosae]